MRTSRVRSKLEPVDRAWFRMDRPSNLMIVNCIMTFDEPVDYRTIYETATERLVSVPRFCDRIVTRRRWFGERHDWSPAENFDLHRHLIEVSLDPPGTQQQLREFIAMQMSRPFDLKHPPWRLFVINGYDGRTALFWQLQHAIGDGVALMVLLLSLTDLDHESSRPNPLRNLFNNDPLNVEQARQAVQSVLPDAARLMIKPAERLASTNPALLWLGGIASFIKLSLLPPDRSSVFKGEMKGQKAVAWSRPLPLKDIRELQTQLEGSVTEILLTAASGALRSYSLGRGLKVRDLRALIPVSLRPIEAMRDLGNQFGLVFLRLPIEEADPAKRLKSLRLRMGALKNSLQPLVTLTALRVLGWGPLWLQQLVLWIFGLKGTLVMSSVPGPRSSLFLAGHQIKNIVFWVPQSAGLNVGLSILTYDDRVVVGLMTDTAVVPEPAEVIEAFHLEVDAMRHRYAAEIESALTEPLNPT